MLGTMATIGGLTFRGLIGNKKWGEILPAEWAQALAQNGWREAHNGHLLLRLKQRATAFGVRTPNELARALRDGRSEPADKGAMARVPRNGKFKVIYRGSSFITLTGP
jgi:hypothetical protein